MDHKDRATEGNKNADTDEDIRAMDESKDEDTDEDTDEDMEEDMVEAEVVDRPTNLGEGGAKAKEESSQDSARREEVIALLMGTVPTQVHNAPLQVPTTR